LHTWSKTQAMVRIDFAPRYRKSLSFVSYECQIDQK